MKVKQDDMQVKTQKWTKFYRKSRRIALVKTQVQESLNLGRITEELQQFMHKIEEGNKIWMQAGYSSARVGAEFFKTMKVVNATIRPVKRMKKSVAKIKQPYLSIKDLAKRTGIKRSVLAGWIAAGLISKSHQYKGYFSTKAIAEAQKVQQCLKRGYKVAEIKAQGLDKCYSKLATVKVAVHN